MDDEYHSLMKNGTWVLVPKPSNVKIVGCRWLFKLKEGIEMIELTKFKARFIAEGFS